MSGCRGGGTTLRPRCWGGRGCGRCIGGGWEGWVGVGGALHRWRVGGLGGSTDTACSGTIATCYSRYSPFTGPHDQHSYSQFCYSCCSPLPHSLQGSVHVQYTLHYSRTEAAHYSALPSTVQQHRGSALVSPAQHSTAVQRQRISQPCPAQYISQPCPAQYSRTEAAH